MTTVIIVIHLMVVVAMVGLVLLQRSEGGALGIGSGSGAFMTGRGAANVLTRSTGILALAFFVTSFVLALLAKYEGRPSDIFDSLTGQTPAIEEPVDAAPIPATGGSAQDMLRQLGGSGPQVPPSDSPSGDAGTGGTDTAPAADEGASLPVPDSAPSASLGSAPSTNAPSTDAPADSAPASSAPADTAPSSSAPSSSAPADGGASPQTPPVQ